MLAARACPEDCVVVVVCGASEMCQIFFVPVDEFLAVFDDGVAVLL